MIWKSMYNKERTYELIVSFILRTNSTNSEYVHDLCAEYFKFAHDKLHALLSTCFTLFFTHCYLPLSMIETIIVPIVKNKCGNLSDSNNYRPIALATIISKLFESAILLKCEMFLDTCPNQFGYKKGHSTDMCIYVLKEFIEFYRSRNTSVLLLF